MTKTKKKCRTWRGIIRNSVLLVMELLGLLLVMAIMLAIFEL